jgi:hypothetical protein
MEYTPKVKLKIYPGTTQNTVTYNFIFRKNSPTSFSFRAEADLRFITLVNETNISNILIKVNNVTVFNGMNFTAPIVVNAEDLIFIQINRINNADSDFTLIGNIL